MNVNEVLRDKLGPRGEICKRCGSRYGIGDGRHKGCRGNRTNTRRDKACPACGEEFTRIAKTGRAILWSGKKIFEHKMAHFEEE